jgi:tellurite resistance protein TerC
VTRATEPLSVNERFHLLKVGLALVLVFVGLKMAWLNEAFGGKFPIGLSLGIIALILVGSVAGSLILPPRTKVATSEGPLDSSVSIR